MKVMILAAGRGNRMRPLTDDTPKPLLKIGQFSLIEHLLFRLRDHDFKEIVINLAYLGEKIVATLQDGHHYGVNIQYSHEDPASGLETGGGILNALPLLGHDPFLVVSGDIWTNFNFATLKQKNLEGLAHLVLVDNPPDNLNGDFNFDKGKLNTEEGTRLTFGNIGLYHPDLFSDCKPGFFRLAPLLYKAVAENKATAEYFGGTWLNIGTPMALENLRRTIEPTLS